MSPDGNGEISNEFFKKLNQQIVQKDNLIKLLQLQIRNLKNQIESGAAEGEESAELKKALEDKSLEVEKIQAELNEQKNQFDQFSKEKEEQIEALNKLLEEQQGSEASAEVIEDPRVPELEAQLETLKQQLEEAQAQQAEPGQTNEEVVAELAAKDEQIQQLQQQLEEAQAQQAEPGQTNEEVVAELAAKDEQINQLQQELEQVQKGLVSSQDETEKVQELRISLEAAKNELKQYEEAAQQLKTELQERDQQIDQLKTAGEEASNNEEDKNKIQELQQDIETLRNLLAEKDEALAAQASGEAPATSAESEEKLKEAQAEIDLLKSRIEEIQNNPVLPAKVEEELNQLREENSELSELREKVAKLEKDADEVAETAMKLTAAESEREQLAAELEKLKSQEESEEEQALKLELAKLKETLEKKDDELSRLRVSLEAREDESMADPEVREEVEQLTRQVADQLLAIQNFESMLEKAKEQIEAKNNEIEVLKGKLAKAPASEAPIPVADDSEVIGSFIDFFDGLDSLLSKNPIPELQALHKKLLDRLIIPNQISYVPVISEEFDPERHVATDYFRSDSFPEKCIVFEVEKGYAKGDKIIKKPQVWVVQNLFNCQECKAMQSNPDSRFCHMCGAKMVAPNGLPVDSLPEFEPTPTTYHRFAERMMEKGDLDKAKEYLQAGLELDSNFVPLLVQLGQIYGSESKFEEALELLKKAHNLKQDDKIQEKIAALEVKYNIFKQAQSLKLDPEEFSKLVNLIQK
jgi:molecular chaperone GrpE (heat shock protein)/uncharacterized coiled-coil DUF342 family protein